MTLWPDPDLDGAVTLRWLQAPSFRPIRARTRYDTASCLRRRRFSIHGSLDGRKAAATVKSPAEDEDDRPMVGNASRVDRSTESMVEKGDDTNKLNNAADFNYAKTCF